MATDLEELERITKAMNPVGLPNFANQARSGLQNQLPAGEGTVLAPITQLTALPPESMAPPVQTATPSGGFSFSPSPVARVSGSQANEIPFTPTEGSLPDLIGSGIGKLGDIAGPAVEKALTFFSGVPIGTPAPAQEAQPTEVPTQPTAVAPISTEVLPQPTALPVDGSQIPQPQGLTTQGGIPLNQFLSGQALPEQGLLRAESPMFADDSQSRGLSGVPAQEAMAQASADRIARLDARPDFGGGISDRDRRGAGDISKADYDDMAKGMLPGASASERGRALKLGNELGVNPATGQSLTKGLTESEELDLERKRQVVEAGRKPDATEMEKFQSDLELSNLTPAQKQAAMLRKFGLNPLDFPDGVDTGSTGETSDAGSTPADSTKIPIISTQKEYDALPVGSTYIDSNGKTATKKG